MGCRGLPLAADTSARMRSAHYACFQHAVLIPIPLPGPSRSRWRTGGQVPSAPAARQGPPRGGMGRVPQRAGDGDSAMATKRKQSDAQKLLAAKFAEREPDRRILTSADREYIRGLLRRGLPPRADRAGVHLSQVSGAGCASSHRGGSTEAIRSAGSGQHPRKIPRQTRGHRAAEGCRAQMGSRSQGVGRPGYGGSPHRHRRLGRQRGERDMSGLYEAMASAGWDTLTEDEVR